MSEAKDNDENISDAAKRRDFFCSMSLMASNHLRKELAIDELNYQKVVGHAHADARAFFLYGCVDEVIKAATASLRWASFLSEEDKAKVMEHEDSDYIERTVLEAVFDEQQMWARKLQEILADLILFSTTNEQDHYRLFLTYRFLEKYLGFQTDLKEFFACESGNAGVSIQMAQKEIKDTQDNLDPAHIWYLKAPKLQESARAGNLFSSSRQRLLKALSIATPDQRIALGISYDRGYSKASRSIHSNIGDPQSEVTKKTIDAQIGRIGLLSAHIVLCGFRLIEVKPKGVVAQLNNALNGAEAATQLHDNMCMQFEVGDIVMAYGIPSMVTQVSKSKYGYTACRVRFLGEPLLPELPEDWFSAPYVRVMAHKSILIPMLKEQLRKHGGDHTVDKFAEDQLLIHISDSVKEMIRTGVFEKFLLSARKASQARKQGSSGSS